MLIDTLYGKILFLLFVLVCSLEDFRSRHIKEAVFIAGAVAAAVCLIVAVCDDTFIAQAGPVRSEFLLRVVNGLVVAAIVWIISLITHQQIGFGDALFFTVTGIFLSCANVLLLCGSMLLASLWSLGAVIAGIIKKKKIKGQELPFIPFTLPVAIAIAFI